ncbi:hypothetical protein WICPIJ_002047 [Wickerhamomyces pijperi]|uniref:Uncharacterized protein n=1 Tax=Wickerhamomyces pijperi TaxID=599730 RepID=A0A9P8Q9U8_WICPI|nr:hypothetical protein WICPIJ_002047 [Wickerhamomyces pijperi]
MFKFKFRNDGLTSQFIWDTNNSGFGDTDMFGQGGFDFSSGQSVTRDVDNVIDSTSDPVVAVVISTSTITGEVVAWVWLQVGLNVSGMVVPDGSGNGWPCGLDGQDTGNIVPL